MLKINDVVKKYDPASSGRLRRRGIDVDKHRPALGGVSLRVEEGQFHTLLGPSGCGKTTLLRSVAGLEHPDSGEIELGGDTLFSAERSVDLSPDRRKLGMVFQSYAIWPHMSVRRECRVPDAGGPGKRPKAEVDKRCGGTGVGRAERGHRPVGHQALRRPAATPRVRPRDGRPSRACSCWTSRCPTSTPSCARRCAWS